MTHWNVTSSEFMVGKEGGGKGEGRVGGKGAGRVGKGEGRGW